MKEPAYFATLPPFWKKTSVRVTVCILVVAVVLAGLVIAFLVGSPMPCVFHQLTGLHCPGCGGGRCLKALLHLDILRAIHANPGVIVAFFLGAYYGLRLLCNYLFRREIFPDLHFPDWLWYVALIGFGVFYILRNIPVYPFSLLAPPPVV
ncbi:MAG: DUF2752 domain-containing protein [Oscillospiraceae bacterium]|nr:DUF2752 domain-containing protein [Oscillospiraceae bacterium]